MLDASPTQLPPTEKQIAYARKLAARNHVVLPWANLQDRQALSDWISEQASSRPGHDDRPSSKQVAYAERIARIKRRSIPDECFRSRSLMSSWITGNK